MLRLAFMDKKRVAVGIGDDGHVADRRFQRFRGESNARGPKLGDGGLEVLDLKEEAHPSGNLFADDRRLVITVGSAAPCSDPERMPLTIWFSSPHVAYDNQQC